MPGIWSPTRSGNRRGDLPNSPTRVERHRGVYPMLGPRPVARLCHTFCAMKGLKSVLEVYGSWKATSTKTVETVGFVGFLYHLCRCYIGGGGGNRTRVRKWLHSGFYVRSPSFKIRPPGTRRARFPVALGEVDTRHRRLRRPSVLRPAVVALAA